MSFLDRLKAEPWRFDFLALMRRLERAHPQHPRIGHAATRRDEFVSLGQNPWLAFPASTLEIADTDQNGRIRILTRFLGLTGPQGALPLATTDEAGGWLYDGDPAFARFTDIFHHRFLQLFFRAWSDARPIGQHERPQEDRFLSYIGSAIGLGSEIYRNLDQLPDAQKLAHAGLAAPAARSASRLESLIRGTLGLEAEVWEFESSFLPLDERDRSRLGRANARLGSDAMLGTSAFSISDKFRIRLRTHEFALFQRVLPQGDYARPLADLVLFYVGEALDWDVELALPAREVRPVTLNGEAALGWTTWLAPTPDPTDQSERIDTRFNLAERLRPLRTPMASPVA